MSEELPLDDIQGIILDDYFEKRLGHFLLFRIDDPDKTRQWLVDNADKLTSAKEAKENPKGDEAFWNIAFTHEGLEKLALDPALLGAFPFAFVEGSDTFDRARILGDVDESAPEKWLWGSHQNPVHILLMVYLPQFVDSADKEKWAQMKKIRDELRTRVEDEGGLRLLRERGSRRREKEPLTKHLLADNKEHFGFRDSISQPIPRGTGLDDHKDLLEPGEFLLGYKNQFSNDETGTIIKSHAPMASDGSVLGKNGSYLVFRQLEQDVVGFWQYCCDHAKDGAIEETPYDPVTLASKMVGRWPSGAPLAKYWQPELGADNRDPELPAPQPEDPDYYEKLDKYHQVINDIDYANEDAKGERCPYGSHIRRTNPRNWELGITDYTSLHISNLHRIIRRGRTYGPPLIDGSKMDTSTYPEKVAEILRIRAKHDNEEELSPEEEELLDLSNQERGLHFLCFNSDIERQFEFVQQQWCNNSKFAGLNSDSDPISGWHEGPEKVGIDPPTFTIPSSPLRYRCTGMKRFVTVKGSGYFFMPSISDVRRLGQGQWRAAANAKAWRRPSRFDAPGDDYDLSDE